MEPETTPDFLTVAQILAPFGVKGEVRARILTDFPKRFARLKTVYLGPKGTPYALERSHLHGKEVLLKLGGVDTSEQVEKLRNLLVQIPMAEAMPLPEGSYYQHQILGLEAVTTSGESLGRITDILPTGANDVYVVRGERGEVLLPAIPQVIKEVDVAGKRLVVELMDGMR